MEKIGYLDLMEYSPPNDRNTLGDEPENFEPCGYCYYAGCGFRRSHPLVLAIAHSTVVVLLASPLANPKIPGFAD